MRLPRMTENVNGTNIKKIDKIDAIISCRSTDVMLSKKISIVKITKNMLNVNFDKYRPIAKYMVATPNNADTILAPKMTDMK